METVRELRAELRAENCAELRAELRTWRTGELNTDWTNFCTSIASGADPVSIIETRPPRSSRIFLKTIASRHLFVAPTPPLSKLAIPDLSAIPKSQPTTAPFAAIFPFTPEYTLSRTAGANTMIVGLSAAPSPSCGGSVCLRPSEVASSVFGEP